MDFIKNMESEKEWKKQASRLTIEQLEILFALPIRAGEKKADFISRILRSQLQDVFAFGVQIPPLVLDKIHGDIGSSKSYVCICQLKFTHEDGTPWLFDCRKAPRQKIIGRVVVKEESDLETMIYKIKALMK